MLRTLIPALLLLSTLIACVSATGPRADTDTRTGANLGSQVTLEDLSSDLTDLGVETRFVSFLAQEGVRAGVQGFKVLPRIRNFGRNPNEARLYGVTQRSRVIYLDTETAAGRSPFIILHEIAHAPHFGGACGGHHTAWATEFAQNTSRFEASFPNETWQGIAPSAMVTQLAQGYGVGTKCL